MNIRELRELGLACLCHLAVRGTLRVATLPATLDLPRRPLPICRHPLSLHRLQRVVRLSQRLCRGSCLTESLVLGWLGARHGHPNLSLSIGISLGDGVFRAHAWAVGPAPPGFVPLWSDRSGGSDVDRES